MVTDRFDMPLPASGASLTWTRAGNPVQCASATLGAGGAEVLVGPGVEIMLGADPALPRLGRGGCASRWARR